MEEEKNSVQSLKNSSFPLKTLNNSSVQWTHSKHPPSEQDLSFRVDPHNGSLYACESFDRETKSLYRLRFEVKDAGNAGFHHSTQVKFFVKLSKTIILNFVEPFL